MARAGMAMAAVAVAALGQETVQVAVVATAALEAGLETLGATEETYALGHSPRNRYRTRSDRSWRRRHHLGRHRCGHIRGTCCCTASAAMVAALVAATVEAMVGAAMAAMVAAAAWSEVHSRSSRCPRYIVHKIRIPDLHLHIFRCSHIGSHNDNCPRIHSIRIHSSNVSQEAYLEAGATATAAAAEVARAVAAEFASMVTGAAAMSARPSGRSRRNRCRVHSGIRKRDCMDNGGPQNHRCLHIFRCSRERYHRRFGTCSRTRTILLQETAAAVSEEEPEAVEAAKCTGDHSRCSRCQEDIGRSSSCTRSLALRLHRCQHRIHIRTIDSCN